MGARVSDQALKEAVEGTVQFHSFPSGRPGLGTSQPRDALVGRLGPGALVQPGGSVNLCLSVLLSPGMKPEHQDPEASCSLFGSSSEVLG